MCSEERQSWEVSLFGGGGVFLGQVDGARVCLQVPGYCDPRELPAACNCWQQLSPFRAGKNKYLQPLIRACSYSPVKKK